MFRKFLLILLTSFVNAKYTPDWESLDSRPLPEWYDKVKITRFALDGMILAPTVACRETRLFGTFLYKSHIFIKLKNHLNLA